jgi:hypothetical protein
MPVGTQLALLFKQFSNPAGAPPSRAAYPLAGVVFLRPAPPSFHAASGKHNLAFPRRSRCSIRASRVSGGGNRPNRSCWRPVRIRAPSQSAPLHQGKILVNPSSSPWCLKQTLLTVRRASAMKEKFVGGKDSYRESHSYRSARAGGGTEIGSALPRLAHIRGPHGPFLLPKFEKSQTISLERTPWSKI